jgi:membrane-bound inhibitor of C-type lysozyme
MSAWSVIAGLVAAGAIAAPATAQTAAQPPMNDFNQAFYTCDGGAFLISYDSETPEHATVTTNLKNKTYELKRTTAPTVVKFAIEAARFWTDGKTATLDGSDAPLKNCKMKGR